MSKTNCKLILLILCAFLLFPLSSCTRTDETSPEMARRMLKVRGFNFNEAEFFRAIRLGDARAVTAFLQGGMNPNAKNERGETALNFALENSDDKTAGVLIGRGADPNLRDARGNAPLHLALKKDKTELFELLLEKGADVNVPGRAGPKTDDQTVLYLAVARNDEELVRDLLKRGADPNRADSLGALPLVEAVLAPRLNPEIIRMLIEKGADVNKREPESDGTALIFLATNDRAASSARAEAARLLLAAGADKSVKTNKGRTALDWARQKKHRELVELLK